MVQINFAQRQVNAKIVYYGPGMSGKTTNLEIVHQRAPAPNRGDLTSISTDGDRTLFFDFMPLDLGTVAGMRTCFQIYTVPGQVYYNSTRKLVLQGVDGVVFVADSSASMVEENLESMRNLEQNLAEYGKSLAQMPLIIQYNKRDLPDAMSTDELNRILNPYNAPFFEAIANTGQGVFPTLKALAARVLESIHTGAKSSGGPAPSTGQTGFYPQSAVPTPGAPQQRTLQQTGFHQPIAAPNQAPNSNGPGPRPVPMPTRPMTAQPMQTAAQTGGQSGPIAQPMQGYSDPLARTAIHAPPSIAIPPMPPMQGQQSMPMQHGMMAQSGMGAPAMPAQPMQVPAQQAFGGSAYAAQPGQQQYAGPVQAGPVQPGQGVQPQAQAMGTMQNQQRQPAQPGALHMMRAERTSQAKASVAAKPRALTAPSRPASSSDAAPRLQPRAAPLPTPTGKGKKRMAYVGIFIAVALGVGAVVAKIVLKLF